VAKFLLIMFNRQRVALAGRRGHVADTHSTAWKPAPDLGMVLVDQTRSVQRVGGLCHVQLLF
jgi:hypothetical protein